MLTLGCTDVGDHVGLAPSMQCRCLQKIRSCTVTTELWLREAYQVRVVFLMVLPELGGNRYNNWTVGSDCKDLVPERLFESEEMADLMLC